MQNSNEKFKSEFKRRLYDWVLKLIKLIDKLPMDSVSQIMGKQLLRRGTSVSANESKVWLTLLKDVGKGEKGELVWLLSELVEIANIFASSIITLKGKK